MTGTLEINCPVSFSDEIETHSDTTFTANGTVTLAADSKITAHGSGIVTISQLSGANTATVYCGANNGLTISDYGTGANVPSISVADLSASVSLAGGTITALSTVGSGKASFTGNISVTSISNAGTINASGNISITGTTTNTGLISSGGAISFDGAVSGAGGTITSASISVGVGGSDLGTVSAAANTSITNASGGLVTISELSGSETATLANSSTGSITVSNYASSPKIKVSSDNITLEAGTIGALTVDASATASLAGDIIANGGITNNGTLATSAAATITGAITNNGTITAGGALTISGATDNTGTINAGANNITFGGTTANTGAITSTSGEINFSGAVTGASGTITTTTGNITVSAAADSSLGTVTSAGGTVENAGSGAVTVKELAMDAATSVSNTAAGGGITVTKLSGASHTATLSNANSAKTIAVTGSTTSAPAIIVANNSENISLAGGEASSITVGTGATTTITGDITTTGGITNNGTLGTSATLSVNGDLTNSGTMTAGANLTFASDFTNTGTFTASASTVTSTGAAPTFTGNATTTINSFVYVPGTAGAGLSVTGGNTFTNFTCSTASAKVTLSGANTFTNLAMTSAGGTLTVNAAQTINGDLTLEGTGTGADLLTVTTTGSGSLDIGTSQSKEGKFLNVDWDNVSIGGTGYYIAKNSEAASTPNYGQKSNWIILNPLMEEFVWIGTVGNWNDPSNWNYNLVPGLASATGGVSTVGYSVKIPNDTSKPTVSDATNYSIKNLAIDNADASLTFSSLGNVAVSGTLANKGTIFYSGAGRVTNGAGTFINDDTQGKVDFNGSGAADLAAVSYYDLIVSGDGDFLSAEDKTLTVKNDMTYNASAASGTLTISALTVTNDLKILAGNVKFNASDVYGVGTETKAKTVALSTSGSVSVGNNGADRFNVTGGALNFLSTPGDLELCGKITASGGITLSKNATLKGNVDFESDTTLGADVNLIIADDHSSMQTATTNAKLVCAGHTLTLKNASLTNNGAVTDGNINFIETAARAQLFTPNTGTYAKVTVNKTNGGSLEIKKALKATEFAITENKTFTADAAFTAEKLAITKNTNATFKGLATISSEYSDTGDAGNISFNAGCEFTPAATFATTGRVTLNGSSTACNFAGGLTHTTGSTTLNGALTTENNKDISLAATTLAADTTINAGTGTVSLGALDGAFDFTNAGSGTLTLAGAVGTTNPPATITVEGQTIISAPSVKTSGLQNYKKDVTFDAAACAVTGEIKADANLTVNAGKSATLNGATTVAVDITNNGTLTTNAELSASGDITNSGTLTATANLTFAKDFKGGSGTFSSTATVTSTGAAASFTGHNANVANFIYEPATTGTGLTVSDGNSFTKFTCATDGAKVTLSDANTIGTLAMTSGGGTLTVNAAQNNVAALTLQGKNGSPLSVTGSGSLNITSNQQSGDYLTVSLSGPKICNDSGDIYYSAKNSSFGGDPYYGQFNHWIIINKQMIFEWLGGSSDVWGTASNWNYNLVPGLASTIGGVDTRGYPVIISNVPAKANMPDTKAITYSVGQLTIADSGATLTLPGAGHVDVKTIAGVSDKANGTLTNAGTIFYSSTGRIRNGTAFINDTANDGTVNFNGSGAVSDLAAVPYYNLIVSGTGTFSATAALTVGHNLTYSGASGSLTLTAATITNNLIHSGGGVLTTNGAVEVQNNLTQSAGTLTANANLTVTNALAVSGGGNVYFNNGTGNSTTTINGTATFSTTGSVSLGNTADDAFTVASALNLPSTIAISPATLTLAGTITAGGGITISHNAGLNNNTILANATTIGAPVIVSTNPAASNYTLKTSDTLATSAALTIQDANLVNTGAVTNGNITFTETAARAQSFTPNESSTYAKVTVNKTSGGSLEIKSAFIVTDFTVTKNGKLTTDAAVTAANFKITDNVELVADAAVTAAKLTITQNTTATFNGLVTVSSEYSDTSNAGNITFDKGCSYTFADKANFITTGTLTLKGTDNPCAFKGGLEHTSGLTILYTALNTTNTAITLGTTTLAAATTINAGTGTVSLGALDGAFDFTNAGSGTLTFKGSVGEAVKLATITVAKKTTVEDNAAYIKTTGLQTYNDDITFNCDCEVDGQVKAAASVATSGAYTVTFTKDVNLFTSNPATLGGYGGKLLISGDIYFAVSGKTSTVASTVQAKNVLLFQGEISIAASGELISTQDIIFLGSNYSIADTIAAEPSQVLELFAYNHPSRRDGRHSGAQYTKAFPAAPYSGKVTTTAGAKVKAGINFYANGLADLGSGSWTLTLPDNDLQTAAFAEIYNSTINNCSANYKVAAAENTNAPGCANIITTRPEIDIAHTVYDDVIYVSFKDSAGNKILPSSQVKIENSNNEIFTAAAKIFYSAAAFVGTYTDPDCQTPTTGKGDLDSFYIRAAGKWNTDADGTNAGATESTDRSGAQQISIPYLSIPKALESLYETLRDSAKNRIRDYSSAHSLTFTAVADKCAPVLIKVLTGQEMHAAPDPSDPSLQADCDAHNFVEFVYSEPVDISGGTTSVAASGVNVHAADDLGATTNNASGIAFAGLATTSGGKIDAALKTGSGSPHALYRHFSKTASEAAADQAARVRVSIAGFVDGTISANGGSYKNWTGYISYAETPSGIITRAVNSNIRDKSTANNSLDANPAAGTNHPLPTLSVLNAQDSLYGLWDVKAPTFAPVRITGTTTWSSPAFDGSQEFEFVGASYSTGTLNAIEVHWFDDTPDYNETLQWFSRAGWGTAATPTEYSSIASYAADVRGGSRPDPSSNATAGGIRYCSIYDAQNSFQYAVYGSENFINITQKIEGGAESSLFTYAGSSAGGTTHTTGAEDGLYCKLLLDDTSLKLNTTFTLKFDSNTCFITDLAGNRIQCGPITMKSIDRTPPDCLMTAVPLGTNKMLVIFSKALNIDSLVIYDSATAQTVVPALEYIPKGLQLTTASGTGIEIDQNVPASCVFRTNNSTGLVLTLKQNAVLKDIVSGVFVNVTGFNKYDPLAGIPATISYIQDIIGNYVVADTKHAFSDFAVNAINPQYIYDNTLTDGGVSTDYGLYQKDTWAVRDWNAEQKNFGTLSAAKEYIMQTTLYDGTNDKSGGLDPSTGQLLSGTPSAFFDAAPDTGSVSTKINENTKKAWRLWHPNYTSDILTTLAPVNNVYQLMVDGTANDSGVVFDIPQKSSESLWKSGDQISFLFKMGNYTVDHFADGTNYPLYAVRLKDPNDITSLDLWSFKVKKTNLQRGGVTILNNVIDLNSGEHTVVQVDMKESGNLNVIVMTLDGNIVTYLRHGHTDAGTHYYNWNGTNNGGSKVARGLYFVRVIGPGIDETRKVMCVK